MYELHDNVTLMELYRKNCLTSNMLSSLVQSVAPEHAAGLAGKVMHCHFTPSVDKPQRAALQDSPCQVLAPY